MNLRRIDVALFIIYLAGAIVLINLVLNNNTKINLLTEQRDNYASQLEASKINSSSIETSTTITLDDSDFQSCQVARAQLRSDLLNLRSTYNSMLVARDTKISHCDKFINNQMQLNDQASTVIDKAASALTKCTKDRRDQDAVAQRTNAYIQQLTNELQSCQKSNQQSTPPSSTPSKSDNDTLTVSFSRPTSMFKYMITGCSTEVTYAGGSSYLVDCIRQLNDQLPSNPVTPAR